MVKPKGNRPQQSSICKCLSSPLVSQSEREGLLAILSDPQLDSPEAASVKELLLSAAGMQGGRSMRGGTVLTLRMLANVLAVAIILGAGFGVYHAGAAAAAANWSIGHLIRVGILNPLCRSGMGGWVDASYRLVSGSASCSSIVARNTAVFRHIITFLAPAALGGGFVILRNAILSLLLRLVPAGVDPDAPDEAIVAAVDAELIEAAGVGVPRHRVRRHSEEGRSLAPPRRSSRTKKAPRRGSVGGKKTTRRRRRHKRGPRK